MAHHESAKKRIRTSARARLHNRQYRSVLRTTIRQFHEADSSELKMEHLRRSCAALDRLASKGIIHRNTAARHKSLLHRQLSRLQAEPPT